MGLHRFTSTHVYMTAYLLWVTGCSMQKVYFDCGAKVDVVDVQGLILSPGFPYNYSSGTHCVWQFFVPVGHQLSMEMFDFDVFESHSGPSGYITMAEAALEDKAGNADEDSSIGLSGTRGISSPGSSVKGPQSTQKDTVKQVVVQEESTKMEMAKFSNSAKRSSDTSSALPSSQPSSLSTLSGVPPTGQKAENAISPQAVRVVPDARSDLTIEVSNVTPPSVVDEEDVSPETQQPLVDACPHDVLYISDLITFSSRFCGSNRPASSQLVFGSEVEMVEVIMELITTTHWGRGFALLFHYRNHTYAAMGPHSFSTSDGQIAALLAAVSGAAFFILALASVLCIMFRTKFCVKGASTSTSINSEVVEGVQNSGVDVSEMQPVASQQPGTELHPTESDTTGCSPAGQCQPHSGSLMSAGGDVSQSAELDVSSYGLTELELGTDEVFVISSGPNPDNLPFCLHTQRERYLRYSDTGPSRTSDWPTQDSSAPPSSGRGGQVNGSRPRAWSVRTFQDFLPALPQLHNKWCSWTSTSPFTKLVDSASPSPAGEGQEDGSRRVLSDGHLQVKVDGSSSTSSVSNASYPLAQPAQRQRRINSASNLRRNRFTGPCFGLLSGATESGAHQRLESAASAGQLSKPEAPGGKSREFPVGDDHISVSVFAISEEEDRQPLVLAEHLGKRSGVVLNGSGLFEGVRAMPAGSTDPQWPLNGSVLIPRERSDRQPGMKSGNLEDAGFIPSDSLTAAVESKSAILHSSSNQIQLPSLSPSAVPHHLMGKDM